LFQEAASDKFPVAGNALFFCLYFQLLLTLSRIIPEDFWAEYNALGFVLSLV